MWPKFKGGGWWGESKLHMWPKFKGEGWGNSFTPNKPEFNVTLARAL